MNIYILGGCVFWAAVISGFAALIFVKPLHSLTMENVTRKFKIAGVIVMLAVVLVTIVPMNLSPVWNGVAPQHRNQYEVMTESILEGHLYIDYGDGTEADLLKLQNPYSPYQRKAAGVLYHWDHAFYNGHYYMCFGIVPVFLLFLPFRVLTGFSLTTYHATQVFAALFICGTFALFYMLARKFFRKMTVGLFLTLTAALSLIGIWYSSTTPSLYCTAISAGLCMEIWSMFFFVKAVWIETDEKKSVRLAFLGSLFGALAFGCRPPIALANILVLPMLAVFLRGKRPSLKLLRELLFAACPYIIIGALLMAYNYARFADPFEFGQSYQLTVADQTSYTSALSGFTVSKMVRALYNNFLFFYEPSSKFPYIWYNGALINFSILAFPVLAFLRRRVRVGIKSTDMRPFAIFLFIMPLLITVIDKLYVPSLSERYRMDIYWLMALLTFICMGFFFESLSSDRAKKLFSRLFTFWAAVMAFKCFFLFLVPHDMNYTAYYPYELHEIARVVAFWNAWIS